LFEVEYEPLVDGLADTSPRPPLCWMVAEHEHPPPVAALTQLSAA